MKPCTKCQAQKPLVDFYRCSAAPDGLMRACKVCHKEHMAAKRRANARPRVLKIPKDKHQWVIDQRLQGRSQEWIASKFNASRYAVQRILKAYDIKKPKGEKPPKLPRLVGYNRLMGDMARVSLRVSA